MSIIKQTVTTGYGVSFPYALKDAFRAAFPSAKWDPMTRTWRVGPRSGKRLDAWIAEASATADAIAGAEAAQSEAAYTEGELRRLQNQLADIRRDLESAEKLKAEVVRSRELIAQRKAEIDAIAKEVKAARAAAAADTAAVKAQLESIVDIADVLDARQTMIYTYKQVGREAKSRYHEAQSTLDKAAESLEGAGLRSLGIDRLRTMNFNRPDRDIPVSVDEARIYTLVVIDS